MNCVDQSTNSDASTASETVVSIIIPTTCDVRKEKELCRAIDSVLSQDFHGLEVIVVANGPNVDLSILSPFSGDSRLRIIHQEEGSLVKALQLGRNSAFSQFFCFLDDDDELLPASVAHRYQTLMDHPEVDAAIINGVRHSEDGEQLYFRYNETSKDPLLTLMSYNWLASCGGMFRSATIDSNYFTQQWYEWTYVAFLLCSKNKVKFIDKNGFVVHADTPGSLSKSSAYKESYPGFLLKLIKMNTQNRISNVLKKRLVSAYHSHSAHCLRNGRYFESWVYHLKSLAAPTGWQYIFFTRKLLFPFRKRTG